MLAKIFYGTFLDEERLTAARGAYLLALWVLVPLWVVCGLIKMLVGSIFMMGLAPYTQVADVSYHQPFFTWTGDIGVNDLRIDPNEDAGDLQPLRARRITVDMPSWGVLMQIAGAFDSNDRSEQEQASATLPFIDKIDHVGVRLEGLQAEFDDGLPEALQDVGLASAAPFEAEGCVGDGYWVGDELTGMGLPYDGVDLQVGLSTDAANGTVSVQGSLASPHASRVEFVQRYKASSLASFLDSEDDAQIVSYERIAVQDAGFVKARNAFCAKRDGVSEGEFVERHIAAIRRRLQAMGLQAGPAIEQAYRSYLAKGTLVVEAHPSASIRQADYHHYAVADQQRLYNATLSVAGLAPVPLRLAETPARPIPENFDGSTWDLVAQEAAHPELVMAGPARAVSLSGRASLFAAPAPVAAAPTVAAAVADDAPLTYDDLAEHVGDRMLVTTIYGDKRIGRIESFSKRDIGLRVYVAAGYAIQHIERSQIRSIEALD